MGINPSLHLSWRSFPGHRAPPPAFTSIGLSSSWFSREQEIGGQHQGKPVVPEIPNAHTLCRGYEALAYLLCCGASLTLAARLASSCPPPWLAVVFKGTWRQRNEVDVFLLQLLHVFYWFIHYFLIFILLVVANGHSSQWPHHAASP